MGIFDRSSSTTNQTLVDQTNTTTTQTDQSGALVALSDLAGAFGIDLSSRDSHDVVDRSSSSSSTSIANSGNTTLSDANAIAAGRELGLAGIGGARAAVDTLANSYGQSLTVLERVNSDSLELLAGLASDSIDASKTLARDAAESSASFLDQAIAGFGELATQTSESGDDKMARVIGFALAAVAAVVVLPALFRSGGKAVIA